MNKEIRLSFGIYKIEDESQSTLQFYLSYNGPLAGTTVIKMVKIDEIFNKPTHTRTQIMRHLNYRTIIRICLFMSKECEDQLEKI